MCPTNYLRFVIQLHKVSDLGINHLQHNFPSAIRFFPQKILIYGNITIRNRQFSQDLQQQISKLRTFGRHFRFL